jgi:hydroxyethylthiazole kinase
MSIIRTIANDLTAIRERRPLVHSITNYVVMNVTANATLCIGALPIMAHAVEEVEEMVAVAGALVLNIGTLEPVWVDAMELAGKRANELGIPVILDPVGAGTTKLRIESSKRLLQSLDISLVRGNLGEVASLAGVASEVRGVESISASANPDEIAQQFASVYGCTVAITGPVDIISDGRRTATIANGDVMLSRVVGTGCMCDVVVAAFASVQPDPLTAAVGGLTAFGIAGELAAHISGERPGTFAAEFMNALYALDEEAIMARAKVSLAEA